MIDSREKILSFVEEFTKKYGYTPTSYQIANELYLPYDKVSFIVDGLRVEGKIQIHRPLN